MKPLNLIFLTAVVAIILLSSSYFGKVDALGSDCWKELRLWFTTSCDNNDDCPSRLRCLSGYCQDRKVDPKIVVSKVDFSKNPCEDSCTSNQICVKKSGFIGCKPLEEFNCKLSTENQMRCDRPDYDTNISFYYAKSSYKFEGHYH
ncbi:hypothetical protein KQX54_007717 [Cotesia glomerata]|uniref:Uncharacterized protein n=1 Tax=Cotesia glomerata TaxID=32391 RepID=A0AAV7J7I9_COTGL|nr:hypothetical protein KQX54_007717 [Cotesia glomerata]